MWKNIWRKRWKKNMEEYLRKPSRKIVGHFSIHIQEGLPEETPRVELFGKSLQKFSKIISYQIPGGVSNATSGWNKSVNIAWSIERKNISVKNRSSFYQIFLRIFLNAFHIWRKSWRKVCEKMVINSQVWIKKYDFTNKLEVYGVVKKKSSMWVLNICKFYQALF